MSDIQAEALRILQELGLSGESSDPSIQQGADDILAELGLGGAPKKESFDLFQPVRTLFGGTQTALVTPLLGETDAYKAAHEKRRAEMGVTDATPWYEAVEARPGLGDVGAEYIPEDIRESLVGKAAGPALRLVGNIVGDPTTYLGGALAKGASTVARGVPGVTEELAAQAARGVAGLSKEEALLQRARDANKITQLVLEKGTPGQVRAHEFLTAAEQAGPLGLGAAGALAYGPAAVRGAFEAWEQLPDAEGVGENVAATSNAILQTGLSILMGKGLIDAGTALQAAHAHMVEQRGLAATLPAADEAIAGRAATLPLEGPKPAAAALPLTEAPAGPAAAAPATEAPSSKPIVETPVYGSGETQPVPVQEPVYGSGETQPVARQPESSGTTQPLPVVEAKPETPVTPEAPAAPTAQEPVSELERQLQASLDALRGKRQAPQEPTPTPEPAAATPVTPETTIVEPAPAQPAEPAAAPAAPDVAPVEGPKDPRVAVLQALDSVDDQLKASPAAREAFEKAGPENLGRIGEVLLNPEKRAALAKDIEGKTPRQILDLVRRRTQAKKVADEGPEKLDAYQRTKQLLSVENADIRKFVEELPEFEFRGPGKTAEGERPIYTFSGKIREAYMQYLEHREAGLSRADAIRGASKIKAQFQNYIGPIEREAEKHGINRYGSEEDVAALTQDQAAITTVDQLREIKGQLDARFPALKLPEESVEGFTQRMKDNQEVLTLLADYNRYLEIRKTVKGAHKLGDARIKQLAEDLGIKVNESPAIQREILPAILKKLGVSEEAQQELRRQAQTSVAARRTRMEAKPFEPGGAFNEVAGKPGTFRSSNGTEMEVAGKKNYTATLRDFTDEAGLAKDLEALAKDDNLSRVVVPEFKAREGAPARRGIKAARALEAAGFVVDADRDPDAVPVYVRPKKVAGMGSRLTTDEVLASLKSMREDPTYKQIIAMVEKAIDQAQQMVEPSPVPDQAFWDSFRKIPRNLSAPWDLFGIPELVALMKVPPFDAIKKAAMLGASDTGFITKLASRLKTKGITGVSDPTAPRRVTVDVSPMLGSEGFKEGFLTGKTREQNGRKYLQVEVPLYTEAGDSRFDYWPESALRRTGMEKVAPTFKQISSGGYHGLWEIDGAKDAQGNPVVMRVGFAPTIPLRPAQEALFAPILDYGVLPTSEGPLHYTVHRKGQSPAVLMSASVDATGQLGRAMSDMNFKGVATAHNLETERQTRSNLVGKLPKGISFTDFRDDMTTLLQRLMEEKMRPLDADASYGESMARGDQLAYLPLGANEEPFGAVIRTGSDGRKWQLAVTDRGSFIPQERYGPWPHMHPTIAIALQQRTADRNLSPVEQRVRYASYSQDAREGVKIGGPRNLVAANHDRLASDEYVIANAKLGRAPAQALAQIVEDIVPALNRALGYEGPSPVDVEYGGLTTSPMMAGVYTSDGGRGKIFSNVVEAIVYGKTYDGSINAMLDTLTHEIAHDRMVGHDKNFHDFEGYTRAHEAIAPKMDQYRALLKQAMPEELFNQMRRELVPEYLAMRVGHGEPVEGVPAGAAEGRAPAVPDRRAGGEAGAAPDLGERVRPGGALPGSDQGQAGGLRPAPAPGGTAPTRPAAGEAAGRGGRGGAGSPEADYAELKARVEQSVSRDHIDMERAKKLLHEFAQENRKAGRPVRETLQAAWDISGKFLPFFSHAEISEMARSLPDPRGKPGHVEGAINMLHYVDLPDAFKARVKLWYDLSPQEWDRSTVEHWADVEKKVQDFIGLDTPENWADAFAKRKGGLTSSEVLLLRQVHDQLAEKVIEAEQRFSEAVAMGDGSLVEAMERQLARANESYLIGAHTLANHLTGQARGLAIAKHQIRHLNPILRFQQDMLASLRERVQTRYKDPAKAQKVTQELMGALLSAMKNPDPGPQKWAEWWRLWRTAMKPSTMEKALEWYKAGLLGWPSRVANLISNSMFRGVRYVEDAAAAALDAGKSKLTGSERNIYLGEVSASAMAFRRSMAEGLSEWTRAFGRNITLQPDDAHLMFQRGALAEDVLHSAGAIGGKFGEFVRFQLKGLGHDDQLAKHIARNDYLYREIYRRFRKGTYKKGANESYAQATERYFSELRGNFENARAGKAHSVDQLKHWEHMATAAEDHAKVETFQEDLGNLGRGAQAFLRDNPFFQIFFPFIRTPTNIAKETIKRTPIGFIQLARKWRDLDTPQKLTELAKPTVGTLMGAYILSEALAGNFTGAGPLDPDELEALKTTGWQPHSFKFGNQWVSYSRFEPLAAIVGIAADAADGLRDGDFNRWQTGALRVLQAGAANITDKTFLAGMDNLLSAASHPEQYGRRFVKNLQGTIIPNSLGYVPVAGLQRALDPTYRAAEPLTMDTFYARLPWLSSTLEPQYGPTGEVRRRPGGRIEQVISPFARSQMKEGPGVTGAEELVRISAAPRAVKSYWLAPGGVRVNFTREERQKLAKAMQKATELVGQNLVNDPNYVRLPDSEEDPDFRYGQRTKKDVVQKIFSKYRARVMSELRPGLLARARKAAAADQIAER